MILAIYSLSTLALLTSVGGLLVGQYGPRFEGGGGMAGSFAFLVGSTFSVVVAFLLNRHWSGLPVLPKVVGCLGCLPLLSVLLVLVYVLFFYK